MFTDQPTDKHNLSQSLFVKVNIKGIWLFGKTEKEIHTTYETTLKGQGLSMKQSIEFSLLAIESEAVDQTR